MGWSYGDVNQQAIISRFQRNAEAHSDLELIDDAIAGKNFWMLLRKRSDPTRTWIHLVMTDCHKDETGNVIWGHKTIDESSFPSETNCPKRLLLASTDPNGLEWREYALLLEENTRLALAHPLVAGDALQLAGVEYRLDENLGRRGWGVTDLTANTRYRMPISHVRQAIQLDSTAKGHAQFLAAVASGNPVLPRHWLSDYAGPMIWERLPHAAQALFVNLALNGKIGPTVQALLQEDEPLAERDALTPSSTPQRDCAQ